MARCRPPRPCCVSAAHDRHGGQLGFGRIPDGSRRAAIQQIILNEAGPEVYDGLVEGRTSFTDAEIKAAWEQFGAIALTPGSVAQATATGINTTTFQDASALPFEDPPGAGMTHIGGFASGFIADAFPEAVPGEDFDFFTWPEMDSNNR